MTARLGPLIVEAADPAAVERFWRTALGDDAFARLLTIEPERAPKSVKNRVHFDVYVRDLASLLRLGATVLDDYPPLRATMADWPWAPLVDPDGNEFSVRALPAG